MVNSQTAYWLAVTRDDRKATDWWCFPRDAKKGDVVFIYRKLAGVYRTERILSRPRLGGECSFYGLLEAKTGSAKTYKNFISSATMRSDDVLSGAGAVNRNFQGTTFRLSREEARQLLRLLEGRR